MPPFDASQVIILALVPNFPHCSFQSTPEIPVTFYPFRVLLNICPYLTQI